MTEGYWKSREPVPLELTRQQQDVFQALRSRENARFPLSQWYLGALYAVNDQRNPDGISQAAHSLREIIEKLPRVVLEIDWFERRGKPSQREQGRIVFAEVDPLAHQLDTRIQAERRDRFYELRDQLVKLGHHQGDPEGQDFGNCLETLERAVLDLFAPITAQDQQEIQSILNQHKRSGDDIERVFTLMERRGANYAFFFAHANDAGWIPILRQKGYFAEPPNIEPAGDGQFNYRHWWPLDYLARVATHAPEEVVEVILQLPKCDNPMVQARILDIAQELPGVNSAKLKPKVLDSGPLDYWISDHRYSALLAHWVRENETHAALELADLVVRFEPDPQLEYKRNWYSENGIDWIPPLKPVPRLQEWEYRRMFEKGVRPLAEKDPYALALILVDAAEGMIRLRWPENSQDEGSDEDLSEVWCRRLDRVDDPSEGPSNVLIEGLTIACAGVFEKVSGLVKDLDEILCSHQWKIFKRLRQHLYARYPSEQTNPWIRAFILEKDDYSLWTHSYEFQQMVRSACEHFGEGLLTEEERVRVFEAILSGPSRDHSLTQMGERFTEELFEARKKRFHRMQFEPFSAVLFGKYADYFQELGGDRNQPVSEDNYLLFGDTKSGVVRSQSPLSSHELASLADSALLDYINRWDEKHGYENQEGEDDGFIEVNIAGLAEAFKIAFRESILPDADRFQFWVDHREEIQRTIFVRAMINGMEECVKEGELDNLADSLAICEWVLSHPDQDPAVESRDGEQSRDTPNWHSSRRAVGDFVGTCLEKENSVPAQSQEQLDRLLEMLCTQFDWRLDLNQPALSDRDHPYNEAINNTRSRALLSLVKFGLWLRKNNSEADISSITNTLEKRLSPDAEIPLTTPEYAMLGANFDGIMGLNTRWATAHESDFFPKAALDEWHAAFGSLLHYGAHLGQVFEVLQGQFRFAVENLPYPEENNSPRASMTDNLGEHLFKFYLRGLYPLTGEDSLLERFFQNTASQPERWATLFRRVGFMLRGAEDLDQDLKDRFMNFFEWRLEQGEAQELKEFRSWLESECLDPEWLLDAFSKTLDSGQHDGTQIYGEVNMLNELLPGHPAGVLKCFAKLTDRIENDTFGVPAEPARRILKIGMESNEEEVRKDAERAHENLLRRGRSDLLDLGN